MAYGTPSVSAAFLTVREEPMTTMIEVAQWMADELERFSSLDQSTAAAGIEMNFGEGFTYINRNSNRAIKREVLVEFDRLTHDTVVWLRRSRRWRKREDRDTPGREQRGLD